MLSPAKGHESTLERSENTVARGEGSQSRRNGPTPNPVNSQTDFFNIHLEMMAMMILYNVIEPTDPCFIQLTNCQLCFIFGHRLVHLRHQLVS